MRTLTVLSDRIGDVGGAERYWETVLPALAARGVAVRLLARELGPSARFGDAVTARAIRWADDDGRPDADAARAVAAELREHPADAVVTASVFDGCVLDAVRANAPRWVARIHDHRVFCPTGDRVYPQFEAPCTAPMGAACRGASIVRGCVHGPRPSSFRRIAERESLRDRLVRADAVLVSSDHMRETCIANGIAAARIAITPPPLPDAAFADVPAARPPAPTLLFASRLTPRKGLRSLLGALAKLPEDERPGLIVAGEGDAEERDARTQAAHDGVRVEWRGKLSAGELRDAIDAADAVAVPSLWPEPFGLVGIEAQARGRPAVAYAVGGIGDWISGAGITVRRGDEAALASAIRAILEEHTWNDFAAKARAHAETYRLDAHVERLLNLFQGATR
ncbi:MAG TPA: glycosyltransferase family 4 protein [Candidatus Elarobacter sp.]|jgi:glycosyltransferase involved in cell wall biosynthesis|nr:glycosyltransferase family 4 protein [Candidatus Elarobacter sp.]